MTVANVRFSWLVCVGAAVLIVACVLRYPSPADAAMGPGLSVHVISQPTDFSPSASEACEGSPNSNLCDSYQVVVTNVGTVATTAPTTVSVVLPGHVEFKRFHMEDIVEGTNLTRGCRLEPLECVDEEPLAPGHALLMTINVEVEPGAPEYLNSQVTVSGGGASRVATTESTRVSEVAAPFGIAGFTMQTFDAGGGADTQAGGHPDLLLTNLDFNTVDENNEGSGAYNAPEAVKDVAVDLPLGLVGNPQTITHCTLSELEFATGKTACPAGSRIGSLVLNPAPGFFVASEGSSSATTPLYNLVPEAGYPAEFGFTYDLHAGLMYANVVRVDGHYELRVTAPGIPYIGINSLSLLFYGNPAQRDGVGTAPFFTNPTACSSEPLGTSVSADSWEHPGVYVSKETTVYPQITGCELLQFQPTLRVAPDTTQADEPSGYDFDIAVPQHEEFWAAATPQLRDATVTLPPGVALDPAAAGGLQACAETGLEGIDIEGPESTEMGEGERDHSPYDDGMEHIAPGHCPAASTVGSVEVTTPVLPAPLKGHLYVAEPKCGGVGQPPCTEADASDGNLFGVYLEAAGSGAIVKLGGTLSVNPTTGQISTTFKENPQLPFSDLTLRLKGGPRAALANPQACGSVATTSDLTPWSAPVTPDATPFSTFSVDWDDAGGACPASLPLAPGFTAGTVSPTAGAFSSFTLTISRGDREQDLSQVAVTTPRGMLGELASVPLCGEPQAAQGSCPATSQIGTIAVSAGAGSDPYWITGGRVYLTGPYHGSPFGLSIVVPAVAGPFNLGSVIVRSAITVDPRTGQITVTSDPLPQILDGVPLRLRTLNVTVNRPGFMFNATNCTPQQITGSIAGAQGVIAPLSTTYTPVNCANLPFHPSFTVSTRGNTPSTQGKGSFGGNGASLDVKVSSKSGPNQKPGEEEANIGKVDVTLPRAFSSRLTTLQRACTAHQFATNPAGCPAASDVGTVLAHTPVLPVPLEGPVYLVGHGGAAFPDLVTVLQGDGVVIDLTGNTQIKQGITYSKFETIPDAPIENFELKLPEGPFSVLSAVKNLCQTNLEMPTEITGQNGAVLNQSTRIKVEGCPNALSISHATRGRELTLAIAVPSAGKLTADGSGLSKASKRSSGRETLTLKLKARKAGKLATTVTVSFAPTEGKKLSKSLPVRFKA